MNGYSIKNSLAAIQETLPSSLPLPDQGFLPDDDDKEDTNDNFLPQKEDDKVEHLFKSLQVKVIQ